MTQTIIVAIIVLAAVAWIVWRAVTAARSGSACASCASAGTCPFADRGACASGASGVGSGSEESGDE